MQKHDRFEVKEWCIVALFVGILIGISLLSLSRNSSNAPATHRHIAPETITVKVTGAVAHPGEYTVRHQEATSTLLSLAQPLPNAVLSEKIRIIKYGNTSVLHIPCDDYLLVELHGCVEKEGEYQLPKKTRICDLPQYTTFTADADSHFLKRKRQLKEGEWLQIPSKTKNDKGPKRLKEPKGPK